MAIGSLPDGGRGRASGVREGGSSGMVEEAEAVLERMAALKG